MFALSYTVAINPSGVEPVLSRDQVWRGLEMKGEDAKPFVKGMTKCEVVERSGNQLLRDIVFMGNAHQERITFYPKVNVAFERIGEKGFITNTISDSEQGLMLTFTFALAFPGTAEGSAAEQEKGEGMKHAYINAVSATLATVRELARKGEI